MRLFLVMIALAFSYGMLFATFAAHTPPPKTIPPQVISPFANSTVRHILPNIPELCTLVCCDEEDTMHYLLYTKDNVLTRCVWDDNTHTSLHEKALVLMRARKWYEDTANAELQLAPRMADLEDTTAWFMATLYREQF